MMPPDTATLTLAGVRAGLATGLPLLGSGFVYGIAFGALAASMGLSALESVLMSILVFSGTAQIAVVQVWKSEPGIVAAFLIVLIANMRYLLMSASLRPWLGSLPLWKAALPLYFMVDSAYATGMRARAAGNPDAGAMLGPAIASFSGWVTATGLGYLTGQLVADPRRFGLDFVVIAFCVSAATLVAKSTRDVVPPLAAVAAIVLVDRLWPGPWVILAAATAGIVAGAIRFKPVTA
jgi:predicted branched-subunit amino acid permease